MRAGLRIDVDTHEGLVNGVPRLLDMLKQRGILGTFYVAMGPDNSGKAVFSAMFRKGFLKKMFRTGAVKTYGLRTVLSGTLLPARPIGSSRPDLLKRIVNEGHEAGPHSWDHRRWQDRLDSLTEKEIFSDLDCAFEAMEEAVGGVSTTAAPAWLCNDISLVHEEKFNLAFASDCRGSRCFYPEVHGRVLKTLQVPATLPTLDEMLGFSAATPEDYYNHIARVLDKENAPFHVLTIHAEAEGGVVSAAFERFLAATSKRHEWSKLGEIAAEFGKNAPACPITREAVPGRHGKVSMQAGIIPAPIF